MNFGIVTPTQYMAFMWTMSCAAIGGMPPPVAMMMGAQAAQQQWNIENSAVQSMMRGAQASRPTTG
jgi:hypothetical protein